MEPIRYAKIPIIFEPGDDGTGRYRLSGCELKDFVAVTPIYAERIGELEDEEVGGIPFLDFEVIGEIAMYQKPRPN
jgi:hypothetical protein